MPAVAFALLIPLLVSCSKTNDGFVPVTVDGVVLLRNGPPLAGVDVVFLGPAALLAAPPSGPSPLAPEMHGAARGVIYENPPIATTDAQGRFRIVVSEGHYAVWIGGDPDSGVMGQHAQDVTMRAPRVTLDLQYQGYRVSGRMVGPGGTALANGHVFVSNGTNTARAPLVAERFSLLLPPDTFAVWAEPGTAEYRAGIPRVKHEGIIVSSDTTIDLSVDGFAVTGTVTGPGGAPLDSAYVSALGAAATALSQTAADGTYRMYLPGMQYDFRVEPGHGQDSIGVRQYPGVLIDADRTLDFDLSGPPPAPGP